MGTGGALSAVGHVPIAVSPVNDAPEITLDPSGFGVLLGSKALGTNEDVPLSLAFLSINDSEIFTSGRGRLTISLHCLNGGFKLPLSYFIQGEVKAAMGLVWAIGGAAKGAGKGPWQAIVYSGGLTAINQVLSEMEYLPVFDWHGIDDMHVSLEELHWVALRCRDM